MRLDSLLKEKAMTLRRNGESYGSIQKILGLKSKGTLSLWFKGLKLSRKSHRLLVKNRKIAYERGLFAANEKRGIRIKEENNAALEQGKEAVQKFSRHDLLLVGASLYWAEGVKSERTPQVSLTFSNSDPTMVVVYMRFVREILCIPEEKIRAGIHIYPSIGPEEAKQFWSVTTGLPHDRFYIVTQVSRASKNKRPFNILPYGTAVIKVNSRTQFYKVKGMIQGIIKSATL